MEQKEKINLFLEGIKDSSITEEQASVVLNEGAGIDSLNADNDGCTNGGPSCKGVNRQCTNKGSYCDESKNEGCNNVILPPPSDGLSPCKG